MEMKLKRNRNSWDAINGIMRRAKGTFSGDGAELEWEVAFP
jgi:hypothetical protein